LPKQPSEAAHHLQIARGLARRSRQQEDDTRALLLLAEQLSADRRARHAERDEQLTHRIGAVMKQERAIAHGDGILRQRFARALPELVRVEHAVRLDDPVEQQGARLFQRARLERDDHPLGRQKIAQPHVPSRVAPCVEITSGL
jgi:hypothetical protein